MLWYKAWLETRSRFLVSLIGMVVLPSYLVFHENGMGTSPDWYYRTLHNGHGLLSAMWVLAVILLMMGGLLREKAAGTASFTLALPVSRAHLMRVRILFGMVQAMALIIIPWGVMFLVAAATGKANSVSQAFFYMILLAGGGLVFFAIALLVSSLVEGEYTAPALCFGILFLDIVALEDRPVRTLSPWNFFWAQNTSTERHNSLRVPCPGAILQPTSWWRLY